ncbi:MAG TPA: glycosyltransferase [Gemmatimonadaceae bacterium]|nr:glycosyltransferase [Gemmatimonadaceae bacterium]
MSDSKRHVLYLGEDRGTSLHRANALRRLGHAVTLVWPERLLPAIPMLDKWSWHSGGLFLEEIVRRRVLATDVRADVVVVNNGELVGPGLIADLRKKFGPVINYNVDDPFGERDGRRWRLYRKALPQYDLVVVVRKENVDEALAAGARRVLHRVRTADEVEHAPGPPTGSGEMRWASEVSFIGTWMPERGPFLAELVARGIPLSIHGDRWDRAREWAVLRPHWCGAGLSNLDYRDAISYSKICIGMLSKGNRDLHTHRSVEIPYIGSLLCAERTSEHQALYAEGREAVFWDSASECADICASLLADESKRARIAANGQRRALENGHLNEKLMASMIEAASDL